MKKIEYLLIFFFFLFSAGLSAQNDYQMKPGETIIVDIEGRILNSNKNPQAFSKYNPGSAGKSDRDLTDSDFNDDGTPKLPGYKPTGNGVVDAENYKKAKYLFYQNKPAEFKQWQEKYNRPPHEGHFQEIRKEEFDKLPPAKQQLIQNNHGKYKIVK